MNGVRTMSLRCVCKSKTFDKFGHRLYPIRRGSPNCCDSHPDAACSSCGQQSMSGPIWKCAYRFEYQECDACHQRDAENCDPAHVFIKIRSFGGGLQHTFPRLPDPRARRVRTAGGAELFVTFDPDSSARWGWWMRMYFSAVQLQAKAPPVLTCWAHPQPPRVLNEAGPRVLMVEGFLSPKECDHLIRLGMVSLRPGADRGVMQNASGLLSPAYKEEDETVAAIEVRISSLVGIPEHDGEDEINLVYRPEPGDADLHSSSPAVVNVHLDARLGRPYSAATVLVYLNDVENGGGTIFPCVGQPTDLKDAYADAFRHGEDMLDSFAPNNTARTELLLSTAEQLARAGDTAAGLVTKPTRGCAIAFWTINPRGHEADPWSEWEREPFAWHGGVRVFPGGGGKWLMQKFKELPMESRSFESIAV